MVHLRSTRTVLIGIGVLGLVVGVAVVATRAPSAHRSKVSLTSPTVAGRAPLAPGSPGAPEPAVDPGAPGGPSATTAATGSGTAAAGGSPASAAGAAAATGAPTTAPAHGGPAGASRPTGPAPAKAGTYHFAQSGSSTLKSPPGQSSTTAAPTSYPVLPNGTLTVSPASGGSQQWLRSPLTSGGAPSSATMVFDTAGVYNVAQTISGVSCTFDARVPWPPWPVAVGKTFAGRGTCSGNSFAVSGRVVSSGSIPVGGVSVPTFRVTTTLSLSGQVVGTEDDWYAPSLRLPVKTHTKLAVDYSGYLLTSDVTYTMESVTPTA